MLVLETGTGLDPTANAYADAAYALAYFNVDPILPKWIALTTPVQEAYLMWASRLLDQKCHWNGQKTVDGSPLRWPRKNIVSRDGITLVSNTLPNALAQATCELAKFLLTNDPTIGQDVDHIKRITADVVSIEYQLNVSQSVFPSIINAVLLGLGFYQNGGSSFAKIVKSS